MKNTVKHAAVFIAIASFACTGSAMAQDRDSVETDLVTHAQAAQAATTAALAAVNAGNTGDSCSAMRTAVVEITQAEQLAAQDKPLIDGDTRIDDEQRVAQQGQLTELTTNLATSHSRLDALISERC